MYLGLPQQLAKEFRTKIATGQWRAGERLPTTRQLAATYEVSINTVQNAFRMLEAQDLVVRHPRRGGYVKAAAGGDFPYGRSGSAATTVGVVSGNASLDNPREMNSWSYWIIRAAERQVAGGDRQLALFSANPYQSDAVARLLPRIEQTRGDLAGMICFLLPGIRRLLDAFDRYGIPWVTINRPALHAAHNFVTTDNFEGGRLVGRCFARAGYDRAVVLGHAMAAGGSASEKFLGFVQGYLDEGARTSGVECVVCPGLTEDVGHDRFAEHVDRHGPPRGVFATGDFLALGALRACRERGLAVPADVGVVGATGLEASQYSHPALTVLAQPMELIGAEAARHLLRMIAERTARFEGLYLKSPLVVRESFVVTPETLHELGQTPQP